MAHKSICIFGSVQGVGYRYAASEKARGLGLTGFIRNEPDGTVYIEVEGEQSVVERFIGWCREGSTSADVKNVQVEDGEFQNFDNFEVRF